MFEQALVPELDVFDIDESIEFYVKALGFRIQYERKDEKFVMLERESVQIMLEQADGPGRRFHTAPLERPYGRGVNFQIEVSDVEMLYQKVLSSNGQIIIEIEKKIYMVDGEEGGNYQFVVADPDGYLLRFFQDLDLD